MSQNLEYINWVMSTEQDPVRKKAYNEYYEIIEGHNKFVEETLTINGIEVDMLEFGKYIYKEDGIIPLRIYPCLHDDEKDKYFKIDAWSGIREELKHEFPDVEDGVSIRLYRKMNTFNDFIENYELG